MRVRSREHGQIIPSCGSHRSPRRFARGEEVFELVKRTLNDLGGLNSYAFWRMRIRSLGFYWLTGPVIGEQVFGLVVW